MRIDVQKDDLPTVVASAGRRLNLPADLKFRVYYGAVCSLGFLTLAASVPLIPFEEWPQLVLFALLCGVAQSVPITLFRSSSVSVSAAVTLAGLILYGPAAAIWINLGSSLVAAFRPKPKPLVKSVFNFSIHALGAILAGATYLTLGGGIRLADPVRSVAAILVAAVIYFLVQTLLISGIIALQERVSFRKTWDTNFRWSALNFVALGVMSFGMASAGLSTGALGVIIFAIPLGMTWYSLHLYMAKSHATIRQNEALRLANEKLQSSYLSTIRALAAAIDAKDHYTHGHSEITMRYSVAIAREMGLDEEEVATVHIAALLHDVGKIAVPDRVLNKPASLNDEERGMMKEHPVVGADLVRQVDVLSPAADAIQHHHERWDGKGYPDGLPGDQIPLWSQIITVADSFQAMTSSRPYRPARTADQALEELRRCSGSQFNPSVVQAMIRVFETGHGADELAPPRLPHFFQISDDDGIFTVP